MDVIENLVVGSGPTGVATAAALLSEGSSVLLVDGGVDLEPQVSAQVESLRRTPVDDWTGSDLRFLKDKVRATRAGFDLKLAFGSDFCYRWEDSRTAFVSRQDPAIRASFAVGGLSRVWGAGSLPFSPDDLAGWPIAYEELARVYPAVLKLLPYAAEADDLERLHPLYGDPAAALRLSGPARRFLTDATASPALAAAGVTIGRARLAVDSPSCVYCGLCLYGCPYGLIWSASDTLHRLAASNPSALEHRPGWIVDSLRETAGHVELTCYSRQTSERRAFRAKRAFLSAGVIQTAKIMLKSLGRFNEPVILKDSQYFVFPFLRWTGAPVVSERLDTLAQLFLELRDQEVCEKPVLFSIYSYNDQMLEVLRRQFRFLGPAAVPLARSLAGRLLVFGGYLHSDYSSPLQLTLTPEGDARTRLTLSHDTNPVAAATASRAVRALTRLWRPLGGMPMAPMLRVKDPGTAYHFGGSFPMTARPSCTFESDRWGRPNGFRRVFLTDASSFPTIPASTVTLNAMANAYRIGLAAAREIPQ